MGPLRRAGWVVLLTGISIAPLLLLATTAGGPLRHTGAFGEPGCDEAGCHRPQPLPAGSGRVTIDVGPYVPGQRQRVVVTITDTNAARWGFQLAAREARNPQRQAGSFSPVQDDLEVWVRCASGGMPPCNNELEYVTHTSVGTRAGFRIGFATYRVDWTAPATDVGDVIFTAAAVGADNDLGTNGDRSFTGTALSLFAASSQPSLREGGIVNAASFRTINGAVAQGALVSLFGERLAPPGFLREVSRSDLVSGRLPIELSRIGADFILPGTEPRPAYVLFVNEGQMNVQVPAFPPGFAGRVEVQPVINRGQGSNEVRGNRVGVNVQTLGPGLFTFPDGRSAAAVHSAAPSGAPVGRLGQFGNSRPARPGDIILVFGTGFGPTRPDVAPGALAEGAAPLTNSVSAHIGGVSLAAADILYAGAAPGFAGLQQFNLRVPAVTASGDFPLVLSVAGVESQSGVILRIEP